MRKTTMTLLCLMPFWALAQNEWEKKFEQLGTQLPTPNEYRTGSGAPGPDYWQQQADYKIAVELDDENQRITGSETVTYYNNAPNVLRYLWLQLDQNIRKPGALSTKVEGSQHIRPQSKEVSTGFLQRTTGESDYKGGFQLGAVTDANGKPLKYLVNNTMMKITLPKPLAKGEQFSFKIDWSYHINNRATHGGRSGYEYFEEDQNHLYTIAQFYPRMAVYDDVNGWQNKQFLGSGEFALTFGNFEVAITVPSDHLVASTGTLQNPKKVLTKTEWKRFEKAKKTFDKPVIITSEKEAREKEQKRASRKSTWVYKAENVRDFAFASSRKFIWDMQAVKLPGGGTTLAMSYYPKEGNPLWERESTKAVVNTLTYYSEKTIDYPYPKAISVHTASLGMEYPMICFNFGRPNPDGSYNDHIKTFMVFVIVHEVGHNWFPMIVNSDERQWAWMDEGLDSFMEYMTMKTYYPELPYHSNSPSSIVPYMKGSKDFMRPIMSNPEQLLQLGPEAYSKPAAALVILREQVMGPELFDQAFKEYAERWAFKHPKPADFFRTMEDASAVDLDWFWKGWFYTTDIVDVEVSDVKWFKVKGDQKAVESQVQTQSGSLGTDENEGNPFYGQPQVLEMTDGYTSPEFRSGYDNEAMKKRFAGKNLYQVTFDNKGGLVTPLVIEWTYKDGSKEVEKIPAEIWRKNEQQVNHIFAKDKEVASMRFDPFNELSDTDTKNNSFPNTNTGSRFDQFKKKDGNR